MRPTKGGVQRAASDQTKVSTGASNDIEMDHGRNWKRTCAPEDDLPPARLPPPRESVVARACAAGFSSAPFVGVASQIPAAMDEDDEPASPTFTPRQASFESASISPLRSQYWQQPALASERISWAGDSYEDADADFADGDEYGELDDSVHEQSADNQETTTPVGTAISSGNCTRPQQDAVSSNVVQFI